VFLDRDGTLVVEKNYLAQAEELELIPGVPEALRMLQAEGYALVVVSNQSGVGRGLFALSRAYEIMAGLRTLLRHHGLELDGIYFCPHRPDEGCPCRKPGTALLERAAADLGLDLRRSVMIGDKLIDVMTGQRAGARSILVRTGYGIEEEEGIRSTLERPPERICRDLAVAAAWLLEHPGPRESD
jgi:histidinol-phosphate phosphatase family protein